MVNVEGYSLGPMITWPKTQMPSPYLTAAINIYDSKDGVLNKPTAIRTKSLTSHLFVFIHFYIYEGLIR